MPDGERICALIAAAGLSSRMGAFKPLLPLRGRTLIENTADAALSGGADCAVVVTGHRAAEVEAALAPFGGRVRCVRNPAYAQTDMLVSVRVGVRALPPCGAFFLLPGDMPVIAPDTFRSLLAARAAERTDIVFPTLDGRRKHPPLIDARLIPAILSYDGEGGLRGLWARYEDSIRTVPVSDAGVRTDLDTPEDYQNCVSAFDCKEEV